MSPSAEAAENQAGRGFSRIVFSREEIQRRVEEMGRDITLAYQPGDDILVLGLLKGSFIFMADLVRNIQLPLQVDFLVASSYGHGTETSGDVRLLYDAEASVRDRSVILVEDIIDSGTTLNRLLPFLEARGPRSLEVCALLHKRVAQLDRQIRWVGFDAPREFLVGYGLDYSENYRHLPFIGSMEKGPGLPRL